MSFTGKRAMSSLSHGATQYAVGQRVIARRTIHSLCKYGEVGVIVDITVHGDDLRAAMITLIFESGTIVRQLVGVIAGALCVTQYVDPRVANYQYRSPETVLLDFQNGAFRF